jgi:hypothetical protein
VALRRPLGGEAQCVTDRPRGDLVVAHEPGQDRQVMFENKSSTLLRNDDLYCPTYACFGWCGGTRRMGLSD